MAEPTTSTAGSIGAGQQNPSDSVSDMAVLAFAVQQIISRLDTMKLVKVKTVTYPAGGGAGTLGPAGTVDVDLLVNQLDGDGNATSSGTVYGIPWFRMQRGSSVVIMDPKVGDIGFVVCADRDISNVKVKKGVANPGSSRKYSVSDGVYLGGILNATPEQAVIFGDDFIRVVDKTGNVVELKSTGIELTPSGVLPVKVNGNLIVTGNMQLGGLLKAVDGTGYTSNIVTAGEVTAGTVGLKTHHHTQAADSHGDTEQPTGAAVA